MGNRTCQWWKSGRDYVAVDDDVLIARQVIGVAEIDEHHLVGGRFTEEDRRRWIARVFRIVGGIIVKSFRVQGGGGRQVENARKGVESLPMEIPFGDVDERDRIVGGRHPERSYAASDQVHVRANGEGRNTDW